MAKSRRATDHPWESKVKYGVGSVLGVALGYLLFTDGLHDVSDIVALSLMALIALLFGLPLGKILNLIPWAPTVRDRRETDPAQPPGDE